MKTFVAILVTLLGNLSLAGVPPTRSELALTVGQLLFGREFKQDQQVATTLNGKDGCSVKIEISGDSFLIEGFKQNKSVMVQPFRPTLMKANQSNDAQSLTFESEGLCLGGIIGSASCDDNTDGVVVRRNQSGNIKEIELRHRVNKIFQFTDVLKCQFE